jgi:hypothetical protein
MAQAELTIPTKSQVRLEDDLNAVYAEEDSRRQAELEARSDEILESGFQNHHAQVCG